MLLGDGTAVHVVIYRDRHRRHRKYRYVWVQAVVLVVLCSERLKIARYRRRRRHHQNVLRRLSTVLR